MSEEPSWDLYRSFLAVIRTASLSGAARALGTTQPTVGRHIDALEAALGMPLFVRSRHGLAPTEPALELVHHAETMAAASAALARAATGEAEEERGSVRLTASDIVGVEILPTVISRDAPRQQYRVGTHQPDRKSVAARSRSCRPHDATNPRGLGRPKNGRCTHLPLCP